MQTELLIKKFSRVFVSTALLATVFCVAEDEKEPPKQDHVPVGERALSHSAWISAQENRYKSLQQGEEATEEQKDPIQEEVLDQAELTKMVVKAPLELTEEEKADLIQEQIADEIERNQLVAKAPPIQYTTTHKGAFHRPAAVSLLGENVELEDGSIWTVASSDRYKTLDWMTGDTLVILPNGNLFSSFYYRLVNLNTQANVKVNLTLGPIYNGIYSHWIIAINYAYREICLEDGSVWKISSLDDSILYKWLPNDTVVMGINDGWLSGINPNILINVNTNNYVMGACIN